jgi:hypothetical protein
MNENWIEVRLDRIEKKLVALGRVAYTVSADMSSFLETEDDGQDYDSIIYGQEVAEGLAELILDLSEEVSTLKDQVTETRENSCKHQNY